MVSHSPRVALVHDYLLVMRGAERTFAAMAECWPDAPIFTLLYDEQGTEGRFAGREIHTSYLQRLPVRQKGFRALLPTFPHAVRSLSVEGFDLVVSSSSAFAHGVTVRGGTPHICYCHSPFRYAWFERERALSEVPAPVRPALGHVLNRVRAADERAMSGVSHYIANSAITQERIARFWSRSSTVIHPPVEVDRFGQRAQAEPWFLVVTELVRHKRVEMALEAARRAGARIRVVGEGPDRARLEGLYGGEGGTAEFLGRVDDDRLTGLYASARAFVMPNVEEFGIAAVEAQAAGRPVIAAAAGGALETVIDGETGVLVPPGDVRAMSQAMERTDFERFDPERIATHAAGFSTETFKQRIRMQVERLQQQPHEEPGTQTCITGGAHAATGASSTLS